MERNPTAKSTSSIFYEEVNDIDIYVEDTSIGYKKVYKELLQRVFKDEYNIEQIFPLGNSRNVIEECRNQQNINNNRPKLFIIDGDFYLLNEDFSEKHLKGLYVLPRYCIENYFIDEDVLIQITNEEDGEHDYQSIKEKINFDNWKKLNNNNLLELFIVYSIVYKYCPEHQTVKHKVTELCKDGSGVVCDEKITIRLNFLKEQLLKILQPHELNNEILTRKEIIRLNNDAFYTFISGKDYLLPLIKNRIRSMFKFNPSDVSFKNRLSQRCKIDELDQIKNYVFK
jgi:hypothetical protein